MLRQVLRSSRGSRRDGKENKKGTCSPLAWLCCGDLGFTCVFVGMSSRVFAV